MIEFNPDKTMLNNYTQNKLSDTETEQLELWLAEHSDVMEDLELGLMFKQADFAATKLSVKKASDWQKWFKLPSLILGAVAASLIIIPVLNQDTGTIQANMIYAQNEFVINNTRSATETTIIHTSSRFISLKIPVRDEWLKDNDEFIVLLRNADGKEQSLIAYPTWDSELLISLQLNKLINQEIEINVFSKNQAREKELMRHNIEIKVSMKAIK